MLRNELKAIKDKEVNPVVKYVKDQKSLINLPSTDLDIYEFIVIELYIQFKSANSITHIQLILQI